MRDRAQLTDGTKDTDYWGGYAQAGYFWNELFDFVPEELELAFRYAIVREPEQNATVNLTLASHNINWVSMLGPLQACCEVQLISSAEEIQQWQAQVKPSAVPLIDPEAPVTA